MTKQSIQTRSTRPVHQIRIGLVRAAIWANPTEHGTLHNVTFERRYRDGEEWKSTRSFGRDDLPSLAKVADEAHLWILAQPGRSSSKPDLQQGSLPSAGPLPSDKRTE